MTEAVGNTESLECYLVGGAVRDKLLGQQPGDLDWVVVGATVAQMKALGFIQVGRDFPVFLHPHTHDEYALARTERKKGSGHKGFEVNADPSVTLVQDLERRDLTINAMAEDATGGLIDPFGGRRDLEQRVLRHVSAAFEEDPLRIFRVARLAAQMPDFEVAPETFALMRAMTEAGELQTLPAERVWQELHKALAGTAPGRFFDVLIAVGALSEWFAELEGKCLEFSNYRSSVDPSLRFMELPLNEQEFRQMAQRLKLPLKLLHAALDRLRWAETVADWHNADAQTLERAFADLKVAHDQVRLNKLVQWLKLFHDEDYTELFELVTDYTHVKIEAGDLAGPAYGAALRQARVDWLNSVR